MTPEPENCSLAGVQSNFLEQPFNVPIVYDVPYYIIVRLFSLSPFFLNAAEDDYLWEF